MVNNANGTVPVLRLFVAVLLPYGFRQFVQTLEKRTAIPTVRWTKPDNLHVTVQFLGRVRLDAVGSVRMALAEAAVAMEPYTLIPARLGWGPDMTRPSMVWMHFADNVQFRRSVFLLRQRLSAAGVPFSERDPVPHVTYGRLRQEPRSPSSYSFPMVPPDPVTVADYTLCSSDMTSEGPVYRVVDRRPFGLHPPAMLQTTVSDL